MRMNYIFNLGYSNQFILWTVDIFVECKCFFKKNVEILILIRFLHFCEAQPHQSDSIYITLSDTFNLMQKTISEKKTLDFSPAIFPGLWTKHNEGYFLLSHLKVFCYCVRRPY